MTDAERAADLERARERVRDFERRGVPGALLRVAKLRLAMLLEPEAAKTVIEVSTPTKAKRRRP